MMLLHKTLSDLCDSVHYLFSIYDLESIFPHMSRNSLKALLGRAVRDGILKRVCRGIYIFEYVDYSKGYELFHAAARLRADCFNYISLETALSDAGIISQMPLDRITIMSSGRKSEINCNEFGTIEFIHTKKKLSDIENNLNYDNMCRMWRADITLAYRDLKSVSRNLDLVDQEGLKDAVRSVS